MKRHISTWSSLGMALVVPVWLLSVSVAAAQQKSGGGAASSGSSSAGSSSAGSGGGHASSGGGGGHASSGGGGHVSGGGGGGSRMSGGDRGGSTHGGGGGGSTMRGPSGSNGSSAGTAVPRGGNNGGTTAGTGNNSGDRAAYRGDPGTTRTGDTVPPYSRPRDGQPSIGQAVPRQGLPPVPGGRIYVPGGYFGGYYPWGYGGLGIGGYYGGFYDPCYDPYDYSGYGCGGYGGYGGGYGGYGSPQTYDSTTSYPDEGAIHLKIKPKEASVFVDGYYVGVIDDFDGVFQKLHMEAGAHRIEVRAPGYETLAFDVRVESGRTTTYKGELKRIQ